MIISISSAPIVDTSVAARELSEKHGLPVHDDPMRELCAEYGFQTIYEMPADLQALVRTHLIHRHFELVSKNGDLLLNYSIFEWLTDWMRWFWSSTHTDQWAEIMATAGSVAQRYDLIYHLESDRKPDYDGYLWLDKRNSEQINSLMKYLYGELDVSGKVRFEVS